MTQHDGVKLSFPPRPRRRSDPVPGRNRRHRLRLLYFSLASTWGFLSGTVGLLIVSGMVGRPLGLKPIVLGALGIAGLASVVGGAVAAWAYRDASGQ